MAQWKPPGRCEELSGGFLFQESIMDMTKRILISAGILLVDLIIFFFPLTAVFLAYILLFNPPWFREFLDNLE